MKENIEEDIKIVQEFLIEQNKRNQRLIDNPYRQLFYTDEEVQAIENILSDYKRLQEEFKQVDHECERLEQKEVRLEKEVEIAKEALKKQCDIADERNQLLIENQKLQKENEELKYKYDKALSDLVKVEKESKIFKSFTSAIFNDEIEKELIPVQKIKDKIEELEKLKEKATSFGSYVPIEDKIDVLQDLLEEKGE